MENNENVIQEDVKKVKKVVDKSKLAMKIAALIVMLSMVGGSIATLIIYLMR
jgi:hypothetical protein